MIVQSQAPEFQAMVPHGGAIAGIASDLNFTAAVRPALARRSILAGATSVPKASQALAVSLTMSGDISAYDVLAEVVLAGREGVPLLVDVSAEAASKDDPISIDASRGLLLHSIERLHESSRRGSMAVGTSPMVVVSEEDLAVAAGLGHVETYVRVGKTRRVSGAVCAQSRSVFDSLGTGVSGVIFDESSVVRDGCGGIFGTDSEFVGAGEAVAGVVLNLCDFYLADTPGEYARLDDRRLREHIRLVVRELDALHDVRANVGAPEQSGDARRIAIGISGIASALQLSGSAGDADKASTALDQVAGIIRDEAYRASCDLAQEHGPAAWFDCAEFDAGPVSALLPPALAKRIRTYGLRNVQIFGWALLADRPTSAVSVGLASDGCSDAVRTAEGVGQQLQWHGVISEVFGTKYLAEVLVPDDWNTEKVGKLAATCQQGNLWGIAVR